MTKRKRKRVKFEKQIEEKDLHIGCLNCSTARLKCPLYFEIAVGFGVACITKDGKLVYDGEQESRYGKKVKRLRYFEKQARKEPNADWRFIKHGPMHGETYQRQGLNNWICIESNGGFA